MNKLRSVFLHVCVLMFLVVPVLAHAAPENDVEKGLAGIEGKFEATNDLTASKSVPELLVNIIQILLDIAFVIAVLFIIIGGYQYMTAGGNEEQAGKGRKSLTNAVIGVALITLSYVIVYVIDQQLTKN